MDKSLSPPSAPKKPTVLSEHGDERIDEWFWLREKDNPDVISHLKEENDYTEAVMAHTKPAQEKLFEEIRSRIQETDESVPAKHGDFWYYHRVVEGQQYGIHCRKYRDPESSDEQILLDENVLASGHDFFDMGNLAVSHDQMKLGYSVDTDGNEVFTIKIRDLATGEDLPDTIENTYYGFAWAADNKTFFYTRPDSAMRPYQLWRHTLGTASDDDVLIHEEADERFFLGVGTMRTKKFIVMSLSSMVTSEMHVLPSDDPNGQFQVIEPRRQGIEYSISHHYSADTDKFYIITNDEAENFRLMEAPTAAAGRSNWREVIAHRPEVKLDDIDVFANHLICYERANALDNIRITNLDSEETHTIEHPDAIYSLSSGANLEFETNTLRFGYTSLAKPHSIYDYEMNTKTSELKKRQPVLGDFDTDDYETAREWAEAKDGTKVPMSLVWRKGVKRDGSAPALLYGYGAYEHSIDPTFSSIRLGLLDRGFVFAIAHVRGGGEMGRRWYEDGKMLKKRNTFDDFIACAKHLVDNNYTSPQKLVARGGSAGGLLMGAITNFRPSLFRAVVAEVPFVDCLTTILDETLPLSVHEWEEWGNPKDPQYYHYMKSYSPYDNVREQAHPAMLVTAGLNDPRVSYWEPAKWVAKLRDKQSGSNPVLLKTEMGAGHSGPSGRYDSWKEEAFVYAFLFDILGIDV